MSDQPALARPRRVTVAGVMAAAACALLVVSLFDAMGRVQSADMHDSIVAFLREPPADGLTVGVEQVVALLRAVVLVSGGLAAAGAVLAVYTLRRHRGARLGLTVVAVLLLFSASFVVGLLPVVVVVAATMLWSREARDWFDGRAPSPAGAGAGARSGTPPPPGPPLSGPPPSQRPFGSPPAADGPATPGGSPTPGSPPAAGGPPAPRGPSSPGGPPAAGGPWAAGPSPTSPAPAPWPVRGASVAPYSLRRPTTVTVAAWLTWAFAAATALFSGLVVLVMLAARDQLLEEIQRNPTIAARDWSSTQILSFLWIVSAVTIAWSLAAMALAALAFRRVNAGRIGLVVSAAAAGGLCALAFPLGWPHAIAAFATVALLFSGGANRWYDQADGRMPPPPNRPPPNRPPPPNQREQPPRDGKPPVW